MSDTPSRGPGRPIVFRVVSAPAGWKIVGVDAIPMSTLYLSRELAAAHARELREFPPARSVRLLPGFDQ